MICARPRCTERENRIGGYCSTYCQDIHRLEIELEWRNDALIDAQHTAQFLHDCLTKPQFSYEYPEQTLEAIEEWARLAPRPPYCIHSFSSKHEPGCESCDWHAGYLRRKAAMHESYALVNPPTPDSK